MLTAPGTVDSLSKPSSAYLISIRKMKLTHTVWGSTAGYTVRPTEQSSPSLTNVGYAYGTVIEICLTSQLKEAVMCRNDVVILIMILGFT